MKQINGEFWRKCQFPLLILCATIPVPLYLLSVMLPDWVYFPWVLGGVYVVMAILALLMPGKWRILWALAGCAVSLALGYWAMQTSGHWVTMVVAALYCVLLLWSLQLCTWNWTQELPSGWYWAGFVIHVAAYIMHVLSSANVTYEVSYANRSSVSFDGVNSVYAAAQPGVRIAFFCFILLAMLSMNRDCMVSAGMGRQKTSDSMNRKNIVFVLAFFVVAIIVAVVPAVSEAVVAAWNWLMRTIIQFLNYFVQRLPIGGGSGDGGSEDMVMGGPGGEASAFALAMQKIFMVVGGALTVAAVLGILYALGRVIWKALVRLMHRLSKYMSTVSEDYEDEITDTREYGEQSRARSSRRSRRVAVAESRDMSAGERIRRRYLRLLYKHPEWGRGTTARENLPPETAPLYEQARYSDHPLTDGDAEQFSAGIKGL